MGYYLKGIAVGIFLIIGFAVLYQLYSISQQLQYLNHHLSGSTEQLALLTYEIQTLDVPTAADVDTYGIEAELDGIRQELHGASYRLYQIYYMIGGRGY